MKSAILLCGMLFVGGVLQAQEKTPDKPTPPKPDTAKIKISPDIKVEALWDGRKIAPFKALDNPKMLKASEVDYLDDGDYVLATTIEGESRAYPTRFIWFHHVINDKVISAKTRQEIPFAVTYCSVCNTGVRYDLKLNGKPIQLDFYGLYNGVVTLCDRESESVFLQASGKFVTGELLGSELQTGALLDTTWGNWKRLHPDTLVMAQETPFSKFYSPKDKPEPRGHSRFPAPFFQPSMTRGDKRLPAFEKVLGLVSRKGGEQRRAYPIKSLQEAEGVINDTFSKTPLVVFLEMETVTANAFSRQVDGKTLTFVVRKDDNGKRAFYDKETETRWSIEGKGEEGKLAGKELDRIENHLSQWYGWVAYFPETTIYGRNDPPQTGAFEAE